ncbi:YndM family protein [Fictibacillus fluitans]|uniref:YndM family protein n=1 Tax=Fictibacillus fluitans TaxID=3058422 RepID=A0ABT8HW70_9BACL|nr:YndM family protein [Fictibacillus sp. NE201]MDN4524991.1 YndM family protein [Fictibacillus sp. NE201]
MDHVKALILKFVMVEVMVYIVLGAAMKVSIGDTLLISLILTIAAYILGDLILFKAFGNPIATISDLVIAFFAIWLVGSLIIEPNIPLITGSIISAVLIAAGEWFFHKYMARNVFENDHVKEAHSPNL